MKPGRNVSCRCLQCGHWKSLYISTRMGAAGLPRALPWPMAPVGERMGKNTASAAAETRFVSAFRSLIGLSSLLQQVVKVAFEQIVVGPIGPRRLLRSLGDEHGGGLVHPQSGARLHFALHFGQHRGVLGQSLHLLLVGG